MDYLGQIDISKNNLKKLVFKEFTHKKEHFYDMVLFLSLPILILYSPSLIGPKEFQGKTYGKSIYAKDLSKANQHNYLKS